MANLLQAAGVTLEDVRIGPMQQRTYIAVARVRNGATVQAVEARPSDAIALALQLDRPTYVAADVLERAGFELPPAARPTGAGLDQIAAAIAVKRQSPKGTAPVARDIEIQARREVIGLVFGADVPTP